mgnify:CR=1 FL=1
MPNERPVIGWVEGLWEGVFWPIYAHHETHGFRMGRVDVYVFEDSRCWRKLYVRWCPDAHFQSTWQVIPKVMP